jgi:hypothetical protein
MHVTLVAYYGEKPPQFADILCCIQDELRRCLGTAFNPYNIAQVHATIISLDGFRVGREIINRRYWELRGEHRPMNIAQIIKFLRDTHLIPFDVQIGGFYLEDSYTFRSHGQHPYFRSFSIQDETAVAIGWPFNAKGFPMTLENLRRDLSGYNVLHKWYDLEDQADNDFHFVVGNVDRRLISDFIIQSVQEEIRKSLSSIEPVRINVDRDALYLVAYLDSRLPISTSLRIPLDQAERNIDTIISFYPTDIT